MAPPGPAARSQSPKTITQPEPTMLPKAIVKNPLGPIARRSDGPGGTCSSTTLLFYLASRVLRRSELQQLARLIGGRYYCSEICNDPDSAADQFSISREHSAFKI